MGAVDVNLHADIQFHHHLHLHSVPAERLARMEELLHELHKGQDKLMSKVTDFAATEQADIAALNTKIDAIATGVLNLEALITTLQGTVTGLTPEEQAALDAVVTASDALVVKANAIDTTAPSPTPAPVPSPAAKFQS